MPASNNYWTQPRTDGKWETLREGGTERRVFSTAEASWQYTKECAKKTGGEAYLKGKDQLIRERNTYGHDPRNVPG